MPHSRQAFSVPSKQMPGSNPKGDPNSIASISASSTISTPSSEPSVENLPALQKALSAINDNYLNVQQDILETFVDRGQLRKLAEPTITSTGKRIPGLKLDHPRQLALMHALVRFAHIAAGNSFTTTEIHPAVIEALGCA